MTWAGHTGLPRRFLERGDGWKERFGMRVVLSVVLLVGALSACSAHSTTSSASPGPATSAFPLYDGSSVVATREFPVTVDGTYAATYPAVFPAGAGAYTDREVIAQSNAGFDDLSRWIDQLSANPPAGYVVAPNVDAVKSARAQIVADGIAFAVFEPTDRSKDGDVVVTVIDPAVIRAQFGMAMGLIANYKALPAMFRDAADVRIKKAIGMTGSELIDPSMPVGQALAAYDAVKDSGQRAIVVVDARKR
jgi:hypothetical protein